jgi:RNA polymerase sigma-70 factor, ECF subfamily
VQNQSTEDSILSEQALINALKAGDTDALATVFERHSNQIYRLAVSLLHDEQQADGVVQNTFLALIKHIHTFEARSKLGTWLYRVAYNDCMMRLRQNKPQLDIDDLLDADIMPACILDWNTLPEATISSHEAIEQMDRAIQDLSPPLRAVFTLRDIEELSTRETADILDISESAVKVRLHRARLALREALASYFEEYANA